MNSQHQLLLETEWPFRAYGSPESRAPESTRTEERVAGVPAQPTFKDTLRTRTSRWRTYWTTSAPGTTSQRGSENVKIKRTPEQTEDPTDDDRAFWDVKAIEDGQGGLVGLLVEPRWEEIYEEDEDPQPRLKVGR